MMGNSEAVARPTPFAYQIAAKPARGALPVSKGARRVAPASPAHDMLPTHVGIDGRGDRAPDWFAMSTTRRPGYPSTGRICRGRGVESTGRPHYDRRDAALVFRKALERSNGQS